MKLKDLNILEMQIKESSQKLDRLNKESDKYWGIRAEDNRRKQEERQRPEEAAMLERTSEGVADPRDRQLSAGVTDLRISKTEEKQRQLKKQRQLERSSKHHLLGSKDPATALSDATVEEQLKRSPSVPIGELSGSDIEDDSHLKNLREKRNKKKNRGQATQIAAS